MKLDAREVALQLVRNGRWEDSEAPQGERPRRGLILDSIKAGRTELQREIRRLLPSVSFLEDEGHVGSLMAEVDLAELELRQKLLRETDKSGPAQLR